MRQILTYLKNLINDKFKKDKEKKNKETGYYFLNRYVDKNNVKHRLEEEKHLFYKVEFPNGYKKIAKMYYNEDKKLYFISVAGNKKDKDVFGEEIVLETENIDEAIKEFMRGNAQDYYDYFHLTNPDCMY